MGKQREDRIAVARTRALVLPLVVVAAVAQGCKLPIIGGGGGGSDSGGVSAALLTAQDPDGVYGISPTTLKIAQTGTPQYPNFAAFSVDTAGETRLKTDLASGWVSGMSAGLSYNLRVYGMDASGALSPKPRSQYFVRGWTGFDKATLSLAKIDSARYEVSWNYAPWTALPAGNGILAATKVRCAVEANALVGDDPFATGRMVEGPIAAGALRIDSFRLGLSGDVLVGCQVVYADKTVSANAKRLLFTPTISLLPCAVTEGKQDAAFACTMGFRDETGQVVTDIGDTLFELDATQNTCNFLSTSDGLHLNGTPNSRQVGMCTLAYRVKGSTGTLVNVQQVHIANIQPKFLPIGNPRVAIKNQPGGESDGSYLILDDREIETDKEVAGRAIGVNFGTYSESRNGISTPCSDYGTVSIARLTGRLTFKPAADYYGVCNVGVMFDDGNVSEHNNTAMTTVPIRVLERNSAPAITDGPGTISGTGTLRVENCGEHCFVGAEYDFTLGSNQGGGKYVELDQNLSVVKCVSSAPTVLQITYCAVDPKTKQLELSFAPLSAPAAGAAQPTITVQITDDGYDEVATGTYDANHVAQVTKNPKPLLSNVFTFAVDIGVFTQNLRPAVAVSRAGCIACHANIDGDLITDFGFMHHKDEFWQTAGGDFGEGTPSSDALGYNTIDSLTGNLYVPSWAVPNTNGVANGQFFTYFTGAVNGFSAVPTLAQMLSTPGRVRRLAAAATTAFLPLGISDYNQVNTLMSPNFVGRVSDSFVLSAAIGSSPAGTRKAIKSITIDYPLSADIQSIDRRSRLDWTSAATQFSFMGAQTVLNGVTLFDGLKVNGNAANPAAMYVSNDAAKSGVIVCIGDVIVKGPLVLYAATLVTTPATPCRFYVDGPVYIAGADGQAYGLNVVGPSKTTADAGNVQMTSTVGIAMGVGPTALKDFGGSDMATTAQTIGVVTDAVFDGCYGAGHQQCPGALDANGAHTGGRSFNFDHLMLNAPNVFSRYIGQFKGAVIADFAIFRLSQLKYVYQPSMTNDVPFPRLRALRTNARPAGLSVFDVIPQ